MRPTIASQRRKPPFKKRISPFIAGLMIAVTFFVFDGAQLMFNAVALLGGVAAIDRYGWVIKAVDVLEDAGDALLGISIGATAASVATGGTSAVAAAGTFGVRQILTGIAKLAGKTVLEKAERMLLFVFFMMKLTFSWIFFIFGYATMLLWFRLRSVGMFEGNMMARKASVMTVGIFIGLIPFVNDLPDMTLWVAATILFSWQEDKQRHDTLLAKRAREEGGMQRAQRDLDVPYYEAA